MTPIAVTPAVPRTMLFLVGAVLTGVLTAPTSDSATPSSGAEAVSFRGHKVVRVVPDADHHVDVLRQFLHDHPAVDAWLEPSAPGRPVDLHVSPVDATALAEFLAKQGLVAEEMIADLERIVEDEQRHMLDAKRSNVEYGWDNYHTLEEMYKWMRSMAQRYPSELSLVEGGRTYEGRTILGVKIKALQQNASVAVLEAGIHAREWITPATATFFINEILTRDDESFRAAVRAFEWHVFPSTNPDGYVYTHTSNRLWRKSRSKYNYICYGADLNRNWPFHWREVGASSYPCADTYAGVSAASEPETKAMRRYLDALMEGGDSPGNGNPVKLYVSLHSYSQLLMFPWGWTNALTQTHDDLNAVAEAGARAAAVRYGTQFTFGAIAKTIYQASGSTIDYSHAKGVKYPFVFELRDKGRHGFLLPKEQVRPAAEETVDAMAAIASEVIKRK